MNNRLMRPSVAFVILQAVLVPSAALGQVGHLPENSPYRDMRIKQTLSLLGGYLTGGRGSATVAPSGGALVGVRWEITVGAPTLAFLSLSRASLVRKLVNPAEPVATRFFGEANQNVYILDGGFALMLAGRKTWRGLAPYIGASMGMAFGGAVPADSVFQFSTKFQVAPALGVRWHPTRRFHVRFEVRDILWRVTYPNVFFETPANAPDDPPLLDSVVLKRSEWTHHATFVFGFAYALKL